MIAYYIHWSYPPSADDVYYYGGTDDDRLYHHKENAEQVAKEELSNRRGRYFDGCFDEPDDYTICERDIHFKDEL